MRTSDRTRLGGGGTAAADRFATAFASIEAALDDLGETPAWSLPEDAVQTRLGEALALRARVAEVTARLVASVTDRELPRLAGASSTQAWLMAAHRVSGQDAGRLVREATLQINDADEDVSRVAPTREAWAEGVVSAEQAVLIGRTIRGLGRQVPERAVAALQQDLVGHAQALSYRQLLTVCRHAGEVVDPEGSDQRLADQLDAAERRALATCELTFRRSGDGWTGFQGRLPDAQADLWRKALEALSSPRRHPTNHDQPELPLSQGPDRSWLDAPPESRPAACDPAGPAWPRRHDQHPADPGADVPSGGRTSDPAAGMDGADRRLLPYPHRLGRALCELIEHLPVEALPRHGTNPVSLVVTMTLEQLKDGLGEAVLDTDTPMSPAQVRRLACNAAIVPAVLGGTSKILDLGVAQRLFDRYQRLALAVRDGGCIWPGCDRPAAWCEAHHLKAWAAGGGTDLDNGCLLCPFHHHLVHSNEGWRAQMAADGVPEVIPPPRLDPSQAPRRHERLVRRRC